MPPSRPIGIKLVSSEVGAGGRGVAPNFAGDEREQLTRERHHIALTKPARPHLAIDILCENRNGASIWDARLDLICFLPWL